MQLHGIHHVTAVTSNAKGNHDFYTQVLGLRLVKKSVNQDDVSAYHLFYADKLGTPGTDMTFFDWATIDANRKGADSIANTLFRVNGRPALDYWVARLEANQVQHQGIEQVDHRAVLRFQDPEGQRLTLMDDQNAPFEGEPWDGAGIPAEYTLRGFYGTLLSVPRLAQVEPILTQVLGFTRATTYPSPDNAQETITIYTMDGGGPGKEVHLLEQPRQPIARLGYGGVHHVAFRLKDDAEQQAWLQKLTQVGLPNSGVVDRFYFRSLYFRITQGILFELATDEPGFAVDENIETLGEALALPPFLEPRRKQIEAGLKPL
ncbi:MAG: ring-cleaving dioxygenase [Chloroflexi bacterium]|nr:ring-cleaving dioxygenase [Chloroflexota bacterium]